MDLEKYLDALKSCQNRLTEELGIHDNFPILLKIDFDELIRDLEGSLTSDEFFSGQYRLKSVTDRGGGRINRRYEFLPGTVELQLDNILLDTTYPEESEMHHHKQKSEFNVNFCLHPYQETKIKEISWKKAIVMVTRDICLYAMKKKVPLCLPQSVGWDHLGEYDRIVYYEPQFQS